MQWQIDQFAILIDGERYFSQFIVVDSVSWEKEAVIIYYPKTEVAILLHLIFSVDVHMCIHFSGYVKFGKGKDQYYFCQF